MRTACLVALALLLAVSTPRAQAGLNGRWTAEVPSPFGSSEYRLALRADAGVVTGTAQSDLGRTTLEDGRLDGTRVSFVEVVAFDGRTTRLAWEGELAGDEIRFTRRAGTEPAQSFVAHREGTVPVPGPFPFNDASRPDAERLADLVSRMTLDEKILALGTNPRVPRLGVRGAPHVEGLHGLAYGGPSNWGSRNPMPTTQFPQAVGLGQTWDVSALHEVGAIQGYEARYIFQSPRWSRGGLIVRIPNVDLARDPRWGRTEESYGEDAYLAGTLGVSLIRGLQGDDPKVWQAASLMKHLLANSNENGREHSSSDMSERLLREYYSVPFRMGVQEGGANAFMASYNRINGIPATVHPLLRDITMKEWGLDGIICTDGGALRLLVSAHKYFPDLEQAAVASMKAGITVFLDRYQEAVRSALQKGLLTEPEIDAALVANFRVSLRLGLLDGATARNRYSSIGLGGDDPWTTDTHKAAVRRVTQKSIVLLRNEARALPLDASALTSIAVIGPRADNVLLDWYSGTPPYTVTPLDGIRQRVGARVKVGFAKDNANGEAVALAKASDVAIVIVGNHPTCDAGWEQCPVASDGKEAVDRKSIDLEQEALVQAVVAANPRTVLVLKASFPYAITWSQAHVPAILTMAHNSQEEGHALADVLFGDVNPAGRTVATWPRSIDQLPAMMDYDLTHGRTYMYAKGAPLYPFGFGLSYTTFEYVSAGVTAVGAGGHDGQTTTMLRAIVKNTGTRDGEEVVQVYATYPSSKVPRPMKQLVGFARVAVPAGETKTVDVPIRSDRLAYWDTGRHAFVVEKGRVRLLVGGSSADVRKTVDLEM
jgi:beta-glucosidase